MFTAVSLRQSRSTAARSSFPISSFPIVCCLVMGGATMLIGGCAQKPKGMPDLAPVSGVVTLDGQPLPKVTVAFTNDATGQVSFGGTDGSGKFELIYSGRHKGASIGMNTVRITTSTENPVGPEWKDPVPAKYNKKTELKAEVVPGGTLIDFELTSK